MDTSAITFEVNKGDDGAVEGFSLTGVEYWAECFCVSFPYAQMKGKARVKFEDGKIRFIHDGIDPSETPKQLAIYGGSEAGVYEKDIDPADAAALQDLLARRGRYEGAEIKVRPEFGFGRGFSLRAELKQVTNPA